MFGPFAGIPQIENLLDQHLLVLAQVGLDRLDAVSEPDDVAQDRLDRAIFAG